MSSRRALALLAMLCLAPTSEAGVTAERTRLVFVEGQREASLLLVNQNPYPVLVQAWVDDGALDGEPDTALAPFLPLPPVFRLEPGRQRSLRLLATGQAQARDRESLYWLNIYEIPPQATAEAAGRPRLTVTLRTQMKVLYRPHGLHPHAEDAAAELGFALRDETLRVDNPTP
ncbi:molecular chaperone, partial [Pseudomonas aeruginosa]|nr:molecular chaperone [Pseudomonas aeruginosa]